MPSLSETQARMRAALVEGDAAGIVPMLVGGRDPARRVAIHRRHYVTSLVNALLGRFPAVCWLIGSRFVTEAAQEFVRRRPPSAPCIAEYGAQFPDFLADRSRAEHLPYVPLFAQLEWHLGNVAIAVDRPAIAFDAFAAMDVDDLPDLVLTLQPGLHYLSAPWPVDDLMKLYLTGPAPERYILEPTEALLEIGGARGEFRISRIEPATFAFRSAIRGEASIGSAAERALEIDATFDPGQAFARMVGEGLVTAIASAPRPLSP